MEPNGAPIETKATTTGNIYAVDVSPSRVGLNAGSYTISLQGVASQVYRIDIENRVYAREYLYQNNLGVWEVLRTTHTPRLFW